MTLDAKDQGDLRSMRLFLGADKVADLIVDMDRQYGDLPAMKQVNETFGGLAKSNMGQLKKLNTELEKNPDLAGKIKANLGRDPEAFRTTFLPAVFKDPENALQLAEQQAKPQSQVQAKAMVSKDYGYPEPEPEPVGVLAAKTTGVDKAPSAPAQTSVAAKTELGKTSTADARLAAKMQLLTSTPGYDGLMERVETNPQLRDAMKAMMAGNGTSEEKEEVVDTLLQKTKENPNMFKNLSKTLDENPGVASSFASMVASDPKNALNMMSNFGSDDGPGAGMMGMFGQMFSGGGGGLAGILGALLGKFEEIIKSFMGNVMQALNGGNHLVVGSNDPAQYKEALDAANAKPDSVTYIDASGQPSAAQQVATTTQNQTQEKAKAAVTGPQQPA